MSSLRHYFLLLACLVTNLILVAQVPVAPNSPANDLDRNWIMGRSYLPSGLTIGESKDFFDNRGMATQRQYKLFNANNDAQEANRVHVMAYEILYDALARPALTTLPAPINNRSFKYSSGFSGGYNYTNFDEAKTNTPDPLSNGGAGTLGWFYSSSNTWEPYKPTTAYPYNRASYYKDGSGSVKKVAGVGETFKMGSGHEVSNYTIPIALELNHYMQVRNKFFSQAEVGSSAATLERMASQTISKDENGNLNISISDLDDNPIMIAKPGTDLLVTNIASVTGYAYTYVIPSGATFQRASGNGTLKVMGGSPSTSNITYYNGIASGYVSTAPVPASNPFLLYSDQPFKVWFSYHYPSEGVFKSECEGCPSESVTMPAIHHFYLFNSGNISITTDGAYSLIDMNTEQAVPGITGSGTFSLASGYYKLVSSGAYTTITYTNGYSDISYNYYNQLFQLIATVEPEGVNKMLNGGINNYPTQADMPFTTFNIYDTRGRMIETRDFDAGTTKYLYAADGNLRFSQNSEQYPRAAFTYITYDRWGRVIETGEFFGTGGGIGFNSPQMLSILNLTDQAGNNFGNGIRSDWFKFKYDSRDDTHGQPGYSHTDNFLGDRITFSEGPESKTWVNYDIHGRVIWEIKYINGLGYKTIDYTYDILDNLTKLVYQKNVAAETFVHYYEYDNDYALKAVYVNTTDNPATKQLQAKYYYDLEGQVKRMELGNNLQGIDYTYTIQGNLKTINNSDKTKDPGQDGITNSFLPDAFGLNIDYYDNDYARPGTFIAPLNGLTSSGVSQLFDGNIRAVSWFSKKTPGGGSDAPNTYAFSYDKNAQMTDSRWGTPSFTTQSFSETPNVNKETVTYSPNGNITGLVRRNNAGSVMDNFSYSYLNNTNRLSGVTTHASFDYTPLGQVKRMWKQGNPDWYIRYTASGMTEGIYNDASFTSPRVKYTYDETGQRISKVDYITNTTTYYVCETGTGDVLAVYTKAGAGTPVIKEQPIYAQERLGTFNRTGPSTGNYQYELTDHLGNVRVVITNGNIAGQPDVVQYSDYYPFGYPLSRGGAGYRYGYQGQYSDDEVNETGLNNFELRSLNATIGRWLTVDPDNEFFSPYVAMGNNPVYYADPTGGFTDCPDCGDWSSLPNHTWVYSEAIGTYFEVFYYNDGTVTLKEVVFVGSPLEGVTVTGKKPTGFQRIINWFKNDAPIISSAVKAYDAFERGDILEGLGHTFMAVSDLALVKAAGTYLVKQGVKFTIKQASKYTLRKAVKNPMNTKRELAAALKNPKLRPMMRGKGIDKAFREYAKKNVVLKFATKRGMIQMGSRTKGPDMIGKGILKGTWYDITTKAAWGAHVEKYSSTFGKGVSLLY